MFNKFFSIVIILGIPTVIKTVQAIEINEINIDFNKLDKILDKFEVDMKNHLMNSWLSNTANINLTQEEVNEKINNMDLQTTMDMYRNINQLGVVSIGNTNLSTSQPLALWQYL